MSLTLAAAVVILSVDAAADDAKMKLAEYGSCAQLASAIGRSHPSDSGTESAHPHTLAYETDLLGRSADVSIYCEPDEPLNQLIFEQLPNKVDAMNFFHRVTSIVERQFGTACYDGGELEDAHLAAGFGEYTDQDRHFKLWRIGRHNLSVGISPPFRGESTWGVGISFRVRFPTTTIDNGGNTIELPDPPCGPAG